MIKFYFNINVTLINNDIIPIFLVFDIKLCALYEGPSETRNECEALIASFSVDHLMLQLANLMIRSSSNLSNIYEKIKEIINPDDMSLVFIDLSDTEGMIFNVQTV